MSPVPLSPNAWRCREMPSLLRVIHNRMGEELFIASTQNLEDLDRWLVTLVAAGASSLQPGAAKSCARAVGRPLARGGATGGRQRLA